MAPAEVVAVPVRSRRRGCPTAASPRPARRRTARSSGRSSSWRSDRFQRSTRWIVRDIRLHPSVDPPPELAEPPPHGRPSITVGIAPSSGAPLIADHSRAKGASADPNHVGTSEAGQSSIRPLQLSASPAPRRPREVTTPASAGPSSGPALSELAAPATRSTPAAPAAERTAVGWASSISTSDGGGTAQARSIGARSAGLDGVDTWISFVIGVI